MIICFKCAPEIKRLLDSMVDSGQYCDHGEAISLAIANLGVLHERLESGGALVIGDGDELKKLESAAPPGGRPKRSRRKPSKKTVDAVGPDGLRPSAVFGMPQAVAERLPVLARLLEDDFKKGDEIPLEMWIFGQHNRLLPVKVTCRALANLLLEHREGVDLDPVAPVIASQASELGEALIQHEARFNIHRDEALSTAFPARGKRAEKSQLRYVNQFIGSVTKSGELAGLLADLKLINLADKSKSRITLTDPGWRFALMPNPVLDGGQETPAQKFTVDEQMYMREHIARSVPIEDFAYRAILEAVIAGAATPVELDEGLKGYISGRARDSVTDSFLSTQRSGAVSRMSDLGLLSRVRNGVRISYSATDAGRSYVNIGNTGRKETGQSYGYDG